MQKMAQMPVVSAWVLVTTTLPSLGITRFFCTIACLLYILIPTPGQVPEQTSEIIYRDFPGGAVVKNPPANAGDMGSSPGLGRSHMPQSN